jgi:hypothetical protein
MSGASRIQLTTPGGGLRRTSGLTPSADDSWQPLGSGVGFDQTANTLAVDGSNIYVSGAFTSIDGVAANHVACWDGGHWLPLGIGLNGNGGALVVSGGILYECGKFTQAGGVAAQNIAAWDGSAWTALGVGVPNYPYACAIYNGELYVAGGSPEWLEKWNGSSWVSIATGSGGWIYDLCVANGKLIIGGDYQDLAAVGNNYLTTYDGTSISLFGSADNIVEQSVVDGGNLYISGKFANVGGVACSHIARYDGSNWYALGTGLNLGNDAMVPADGGLYAFSNFTNISGCAAFWNGTSWSSLGSGLVIPGINNLFSQLSSGGIVVVGGFSSAGGKQMGGIAVYNNHHYISYPLSFTASSDVTFNGILNALDGFGNPLTVSIISYPQQGSLTLLDAATGLFAYTSALGYVGSDSFTFSGTGTEGSSNTGLVSITVTSNSAPAVAVTSPASQVNVAANTQLMINGTASSSVGLSSLSYSLSGAISGGGSLPVGSTWSFITPILAVGTTAILVTAVDTSGNVGNAAVEIRASVPAVPAASGSTHRCGGGSIWGALLLCAGMLALRVHARTRSARQ